MESTLRIDFQKTVAQLIEHDIGCPLLALATSSQLKRLTRRIIGRNLYDFPLFIQETVRHLGLTDDPESFVHEHLEHLLWVQHRSALWRSGAICSARSVRFQLKVEGTEHLRATSGFPTILITPMTLSPMDGLWVIHSASDSRHVVLYGEDTDQSEEFARAHRMLHLSNITFQGSSAAAPREILRVLRQGGVFLTYSDFVYAGHKVHPGRLMGQPWAFSSSFISLCARNDTMLLPCAVERENKRLTLRFEPPVQVILPQGTSGDRRWTTNLLGATISRLLEAMILRNPRQWLLLSTVFAECRHRAFS